MNTTVQFNTSTIVIYSVIVLVSAFVCGFACEAIVKSKGHPKGHWFLCGFLLGWIGLLLAVLKPRAVAKQDAPQQPTYANNAPQQPFYEQQVPPQQPIYAQQDPPQQPIYDQQVPPQQPIYDQQVPPQQQQAFTGSTAPHGDWVCPVCSTVNKGDFCLNCGKTNPFR